MTNQYDNSRQINLWMISNSKEFQVAIESLLLKVKQDLKANHNLKRFRTSEYKLALQHIVADLIICYHEDKSKYLAYSRNHNDYTSSSRYNPKHLASKPVTRLVDSLASLNLIEHKLGFQDQKTKVSKLSRIKANDSLIDLFQEITSTEFYELLSKESIILKSVKDDKGRSVKVEYEDTVNTSKYRSNLELINQRIAAQNIVLKSTEEQLDQMLQELNGKGEDHIDLSSTRLARIFNNNSFAQGGRFYGAWWMSIPSKYRQLIRINGIRTSEVDYSTMHFTMLYAEKGLQAPDGDLYQVDGIERKKIKLALNTALNSSNEQSAISAIKQNQFPDKTKEEVKEILELTLDKHQAIRDYFYTGKGVELQFKDSQIAEDVMLEMWDKWNEVVLPVHDSFLVTRGMIGQLQKQMEESFSKITGFDCKLELKKRDEDLMDPIEQASSKVIFDNTGNIIKAGVNAADIEPTRIFGN